MEDVVLTSREADAFLKVHTGFLAKKRVSGGGPGYCKVGRAVRYRTSDLRAWLEANRHQSTSSAA